MDEPYGEEEDWAPIFYPKAFVVENPHCEISQFKLSPESTAAHAEHISRVREQIRTKAQAAESGAQVGIGDHIQYASRLSRKITHFVKAKEEKASDPHRSHFIIPVAAHRR